MGLLPKMLAVNLRHLLLSAGLLSILFCGGCISPTLNAINRWERARTPDEAIERSAAWQVAADSETTFARGVDAELRGDLAAAEAAFRADVEERGSRPGDVEKTSFSHHRVFLARVLLRQGKTAEAVEQCRIFEKLVMTDYWQQMYLRQMGTASRLTDAYFFKLYAGALEQQGQPEEALEKYRRALALGADEVRPELTRLEKLIQAKDETRRQGIERRIGEKRTLAEKHAAAGRIRDALALQTEALALSLELTRGMGVDLSQAGVCIELARRLNPPPAIDDEAKKHALYAQTALKTARDDAGYDKAIAEYRQAIVLAPWWADLYINTALVLEQRRQYAEAVQILGLYQKASPEAADRAQVQAKIYELEYAAKEAATR